MNKMKRILTIVLTLALIVTMMPMNLTNVNAKSTTRHVRSAGGAEGARDYRSRSVPVPGFAAQTYCL